MLWLEAHRPKSFDDITSHKEIVNILQSYTLESLPNLIFHGQPGHNKRTMLLALIKHVYGSNPVLVQKSIELKIPSGTLTVNYLEANEMVEISPSEYGTKDRHVVQGLIKEMAQVRPLFSLLGDKKRSVKILVIDKAEELSRDAQAALRRTMEVYSGHFRIFMICNEVSKLIEPIRSRALFVRMRGFNKDELSEICNEIARKEGYSVPQDVIGAIVENSRGNGERAICLLELYSLNKDDGGVKRHRSDMAGFKLDWETKIEKLAKIIITNPRVESFSIIRKEFYELLTLLVSPSEIIIGLTRHLCQTNFELASFIVSSALLYEERMRHGSKSLLHLEAFAATALSLYAKNNKK
ncbi:replication factor C subunit 3/5 [Pancytospora epiphaga]|nr:replication factor C subunit 3/5 [Pancytospora epiphaga]